VEPVTSRIPRPNGVMVSCPGEPSAGGWYSATAVAMRGVKPTNQADLFSCDVPVLPAIGRSSGSIHRSPEPLVTTRVMAKVASATTSASKTCSRVPAPWYATLPSVMYRASRTMNGADREPCAAKVANADAMSSGWTVSVPSTLAGLVPTSVVMPARWATAAVFSGPTSRFSCA
jgi:hypothetical protein